MVYLPAIEAVGITIPSTTVARFQASLEGLFALQLHDYLVHDVEVAHQVEAGVRVVQALVGARGVEDVKRTLATDVEPLGEERHNAPYLVPH